MDKLINKTKNLLKKSSAIRNFGILFRRKVLHSKHLYFLSGSTRPLSAQYGFERGKPLDRYYIEDFLGNNSVDIKGACLEVHNSAYLDRYGEEKVTQKDVLDIDQNNENANIVDDLRKLEKIKDDTYDCIVLTQVFQFIDDVEAAISEVHRVLVPGGVLLVTLPSLSRADCASGVSGDYWRFTVSGASYMFGKKFSADNVQVESRGNVRTGLYFYAGLSVSDVPKKILEKDDENFSTIVTVRAVKS